MGKLHKLDKAQRTAIIAAVAKGASPRDIAYKYGVSTQHVYFICKPVSEKKYINKKRALLNKLKESA